MTEIEGMNGKETTNLDNLRARLNIYITKFKYFISTSDSFSVIHLRASTMDCVNQGLQTIFPYPYPMCAYDWSSSWITILVRRGHSNRPQK